jgi:hypothetical protein
MKNLKIGEYREGVTLSKTREGTLVDIGVEHPALVVNTQLAANKRVTVKVAKTGEHARAELADRGEIPVYWGYIVTVQKHSFGSLVKTRGFDLTIATSKYGSPFADVVEQIAARWKKAKSILVAFGAPTRGLGEIVEEEGLRLNEVVDFVVNTIPMQGTETVRTEEALIASLAILNITLPLKT